jgi:ABC-type transport system substrate-binding protein
VTRDVFGFEDPVVTNDLQQALTNVNPTEDENLILAADARMWLDLPTIPLFQQPEAFVHDSNVQSVSESPTWAGIFWNAQDWAVQVRPVVVPTLVPPSS